MPNVILPDPAGYENWQDWAYENNKAILEAQEEEERERSDEIYRVARVPYGGLFLTTPVETVISSTGAYVKALGTTTGHLFRDFDMPVNNRLRYTGRPAYHMHISCSISMITAGNQKKPSFKLFLWDDSAGSGALADGSQVNRFVATGADEGSTALHWDMMLNTNDYVELHVANLTDTTNVTVTNIYMFLMGMITGAKT